MNDDCIAISEWPPPVTDDLEDEEISEEKENVSKRSLSPIVSESESVLKKVRPSYSFPRAEKLLAGWVRRNFVRLKKCYNFPEICNPKTLLNIASDTSEGQELLQNALKDSLEDCDTFINDPEYHFILATYYDKLGDKEMATRKVVKSLTLLKLDPEILLGTVSEFINALKNMDELRKELLWLFSKLSFEKSMKAADKLTSITRNVAIIDYKDISLGKFKEDFCRTNTPVLFKNVPSPTKDIWTLQYIEEKAGSCKFAVKSPTAGSTEWAGLESVGQQSVAQFLSGDGPADSQYLFDWSLPLHAPLLDQNFTIPHLFQDDHLKKTSPTSLYHKSWPSLFIAKAGTNSGLHLDAFGSHFWMFLISGRKKWTFYAPEDSGALNPKFYDSLDPVFRPTLDQMESVKCYSLVLEPGQLLFVPSGSPHRVENIQDTLAVSGNFVNETNLGAVVKHLKINALNDPRSEDLLVEFLNMNIVE